MDKKLLEDYIDACENIKDTEKHIQKLKKHILHQFIRFFIQMNRVMQNLFFMFQVLSKQKVEFSTVFFLEKNLIFYFITLYKMALHGL